MRTLSGIHTCTINFCLLIFPCIILAARSARSVADNMGKLQEDRDYIERIVREMAGEVAERGTFTSLSSALQQYWEKKETMETEILELAFITKIICIQRTVIVSILLCMGSKRRKCKIKFFISSFGLERRNVERE